MCKVLSQERTTALEEGDQLTTNVARIYIFFKEISTAITLGLLWIIFYALQKKSTLLSYPSFVIKVQVTNIKRT